MEQPVLVSVEVDRDRLPHAVIVRVRGELDYGTTPRLVEAVGAEPPPGAAMILVLDELEFCDSSALGAMIALHKAAGGRLYLTGVQPQVRSAITVTSLDQLFLMRDDLAAALADVGCP